MRRLFEFIRSVYVVVLFVLLEVIAINVYARSDLYAQAKILGYSTRVVGSAQGVLFGFRGYFSLRKKNDILLSRVKELERELSLYQYMQADSMLWALSQVDSPRSYICSSVVSNTISRRENYITLNRGQRDGVHRNMAVTSPDGVMVGYIVATTERYSIAISVLNTRFRGSGKIEGEEYMGSIFWTGQNRYQLEMRELSKYATINVGDEIVTTGHSQIFPEGIKIGRVVSFALNQAATAYNATIDVACDISALSQVLIISNNNYVEVETLQREGM